jgi:AhpD family alkylhydroperoxidase
MSYPHLVLVREDGAPDEASALFARAHQKFGPSRLPGALVALGSSPALFRDAMLNLERVLGEKGELSRADRLTMGVGIATALGAPSLAAWIDAMAEGAGVPPERRKAAVEVAMTCLTYNAYYRSRSMLEEGPITAFEPQLRASPFVQSALEKRLVEVLTVAVSIAGNCRSCANGHAATALQLGATPTQIDEVIRLQAVLAGLAPLDGQGQAEEP